MSLPYRMDSERPGRVAVPDNAIRKHALQAGGDMHVFKPNLRRIVEDSFRDVLPSVHGEDPNRHHSEVWYFTLGRREDLLKGALPLKKKTSIPRPAVEDLAKAFEKFKEACGRGTPDAKSLGKAFKLPNPDIAPGLYLLHGHGWNRKLTALWGFDANDAAPGASLPAGDAIAALQRRAIPAWWAGLKWLAPRLGLLLALALLVVNVPRGIAWAKYKWNEGIYEPLLLTVGKPVAPAAEKVLQRAEQLSKEAVEIENKVKEAQRRGESTAGMAKGVEQLRADRQAVAENSAKAGAACDEREKDLRTLQDKANELGRSEDERTRRTLQEAGTDLAKAREDLEKAGELQEKLDRSLEQLASLIKDPTNSKVRFAELQKKVSQVQAIMDKARNFRRSVEDPNNFLKAGSASEMNSELRVARPLLGEAEELWKERPVDAWKEVTGKDKEVIQTAENLKQLRAELEACEKAFEKVFPRSSRP